MADNYVNPAQVEKFLKGVNYPINKQDLISSAQREGADQNVINTLQHLPEQTFQSPIDISEAIGKIE